MEKRWHIQIKKEVEDARVDAFLKEVIDISRKYSLSISHEDSQGAFIVEELSNDNLGWLWAAMVRELPGKIS